MKMSNEKSPDKKITDVVNEIAKTYIDDSGTNFIDISNLPVREKILEILDLLTEVLFPGYTGKRTVTSSNINFIVIDNGHLNIDAKCRTVTPATAEDWPRTQLCIY